MEIIPRAVKLSHSQWMCLLQSSSLLTATPPRIRAVGVASWTTLLVGCIPSVVLSFIMPAYCQCALHEDRSSARFAPGQCRCADVCFIMHAEYIIKNGGLDTEKDYSYWSVGGMCNKLREGAGLLLQQ